MRPAAASTGTLRDPAASATTPANASPNAPITRNTSEMSPVGRAQARLAEELVTLHPLQWGQRSHAEPGDHGERCSQ